MKKTILITGASSGIGKSTVKLFSQKGWNVAATLRNPDEETQMQNWTNVKLYRLDVTNESEIKATVETAINDFGGIDVICNNAGYSATGIFEKSTSEQVKRQFETNVFGCMNLIRAVLPHFRGKRSGTIINITSMGGLITFPIYSVYHGTKWAMEGFSESLAYELRPLGIEVKCIEPGAIKTDFYSRSQDLFKNGEIVDYDKYEKTVLANIRKEGEKAPEPGIVAKVIYNAATNRSSKLRYPVSLQSAMLLTLRKILPLNAFSAIVRKVVEKGF